MLTVMSELWAPAVGSLTATDKADVNVLVSDPRDRSGHTIWNVAPEYPLAPPPPPPPPQPEIRVSNEAVQSAQVNRFTTWEV